MRKTFNSYIGIGSDVIIVAPGVSVKFTCNGPDGEFPPTWLLNGRAAKTEGNCYRSRFRRTGGLNATASLTINGNHTCNMFKARCRIYRESQFLYLDNTTLTFQGSLSLASKYIMQLPYSTCVICLISCCTSVSYHYTILSITGHLPSPENVLINKSVNSSTIEWNPPYSSMNSNTIHVDPHITQYTVYITDNYTGNNIVKENVTETQYISNTQLCPMYQVSAWNAGGEGELSEPVQESIPRGNLTTN